MDTQLRPEGTPAQPDVPSFTSAKERAQAAQKQFQAIVDKYPHTRTADMAHYFLGVTAASLSDNAAAERNFKQVASAGNREVAAVAKSALASLYGQTNRTKEAAALYQELINKPTASVGKVTAQLQLAELYQIPTSRSTPSASTSKSKKKIPAPRRDSSPPRNWPN